MHAKTRCPTGMSAKRLATVKPLDMPGLGALHPHKPILSMHIRHSRFISAVPANFSSFQ